MAESNIYQLSWFVSQALSQIPKDLSNEETEPYAACAKMLDVLIVALHAIRPKIDHAFFNDRFDLEADGPALARTIQQTLVQSLTAYHGSTFNFIEYIIENYVQSQDFDKIENILTKQRALEESYKRLNDALGDLDDHPF